MDNPMQTSGPDRQVPPNGPPHFMLAGANHDLPQLTSRQGQKADLQPKLRHQRGFGWPRAGR